jgi:hypothetical protein
LPHAPVFFDTRDDDTFIKDDVGVELADLETAKAVAATSLAELAMDVLPSSLRRKLAVEVRDKVQCVLKTFLHFEAVVLVA